MTELKSLCEFLPTRFRSQACDNPRVRLRQIAPFCWVVESLDGKHLSAHETDVQACIWWGLLVDYPTLGAGLCWSCQADEDFANCEVCHGTSCTEECEDDA